ncbi:hypothetical protein [Neisseria basseii]|uniref:hypothetical protein n=1 Tax=Neisseria basseii TaxID=2830650 RepID=UPI002658ED91|nr:hypothetical protein [Neisseria basseii]
MSDWVKAQNRAILFFEKSIKTRKYYVLADVALTFFRLSKGWLRKAMRPFLMEHGR